ncbi:vesicle-trafficking protein sec22c [Limosa lapponica baueri]|uniref:Vesicle-trafficking protein sec22c n=1 Tax=Limosa lapponica baueri TaxID=1758121 RepID=A0A2I0T3E5_LIMLA|nr:vesicle-trafficking protein sec22c [Limosa lapponica baueri]
MRLMHKILAFCLIITDNVIQKVKHHFNRASRSQMKANWEKIEEELKFQPPVQLKLEDTELMNGMTNGGPAGVHVEKQYIETCIVLPWGLEILAMYGLPDPLQ